jgi:uncharacterized membrane protein YhaH (DUF805 family)
VLSFYFSPFGRISRKQFWLQYVLVYLAIVIAAYFVDYFFFPESVDSNGPAGLVANLVTLWPQIALTSKRFHDRSMSGWWQIAFNIAVGGGVYFAYSALLELEANDYEMMEHLQMPLLVGGGLFVVFGLLELVILGFMKGVSGPNKYGDDPLNPTARVAEVFA